MKIIKGVKKLMKSVRTLRNKPYRKEQTQQAYKKLLKNILYAPIFLVIFSSLCYAEKINDNKAVHAIMGEARGEGYYGMKLCADAIRNRDTLHGVYGLNVSIEKLNKEPKYIWDWARKAWRESQYYRNHDGTHWGSKTCDKAWIRTMRDDGYIETANYKNQIYFKKNLTN